jgi:hypothetical protein
MLHHGGADCLRTGQCNSDRSVKESVACAALTIRAQLRSTLVALSFESIEFVNLTAMTCLGLIDGSRVSPFTTSKRQPASSFQNFFHQLLEHIVR